jgi:signal transduction histidine kinase
MTAAGIPTAWPLLGGSHTSIMYTPPGGVHKPNSLACESTRSYSLWRALHVRTETMKRMKPFSLLRSGWMVLAVAVLIAAFLSADWYYFTETRRNLDDEFGRRLIAIAELAAADIASSAGSSGRAVFSDAAAASSIRDVLDRIRREHDLFNVVVLGEDFVALLSLESSLYPEGVEYPHWNMDYEALARAFQGEAAATILYEEGDGYLKAGYAPLPAAAGARTAAVVGIEASAGFLESLERLRLILIAVTGISIAGVMLFTIFALKATSSLIRARESLMQSETLATMGRMAAGIAHEIRNPLFIIRSGAEKLMEKHPESRADIGGYIVDEVDRMNGILTDYLLFAKDEPSSHGPMDLAATLKRSLGNVRDSAAASGVSIETGRMLEEAPFIGEDKRIQQAFLNILLNAQQAIPGDGTITVSLALENGRYVVRFRDTGEGIAAKNLGKIFEPFYTTKSRGSGLGLAITKKIVEEHEGAISVESALNAGSTVSLSFPVPTGSTGAGGAIDGV